MKKFLKSIDLFGFFPNLTIKNEKHYQTQFGGIISIFLTVFTITATCFFGQELIYKESPSVNLSTEAYTNPEKIPFFGNFEFILGVQNSDKIMEINDTIFYVKANIFTTIVNKTGTFNYKENIDVGPCDQVRPSEANRDLFKMYDLHSFFCFADNQKIGNDQLYVNEFWGHDQFRMIQIKIFECKNTTSKQTCAPKEVIDKMLNLTTISIYMVDSFVQTRNYSYPFHKGLKEYFFHVSQNFHLSITQYIRHIKVFSDDGLLFTSSKETKGFKLEEIKEYTIYQRDSDNFVSFTIQLNNVLDGYYRKYDKLQDLAAEVGGIYKALFIGCAVITMFFQETSYYTYLINQFFNITPSPPTDKNVHSSSKNNFIISTRLNNNTVLPFSSKNDVSSQNSTINNIQNNNIVISPTQKNVEINSNRSSNKKVQYHKSKFLKVSCFDKTLGMAIIPNRCRKRKVITDCLYKKGKEGLNSELNVIHVVKTIYEFFLFKKYTLNSKQYLLFETVSKPSLNYAEARLGKKSLRTRNYSQKSLNCLSNTKIDNFLEKSCSIQKSRVEK